MRPPVRGRLVLALTVRATAPVAVGADVAIPADAQIVEPTNRSVYPGFIDLTSTIGLPSVVPSR